MNFNQFPADIIVMILNNLKRVEDLIAWSKVNKYNREFCIKRRNMLLKKYNICIYGIRLQEQEIIRVINYRMVTQTVYSCPICLKVYRDLYLTCITYCSDCGRTMCAVMGDTYLNTYYSKEPEYVDNIYKFVYRCEVCRLYYHDGQKWASRTLTSEEIKQKHELLNKV
jgi:uncharacterized protein with PIN domain